jgi:TPR repeat protein
MAVPGGPPIHLVETAMSSRDFLKDLILLRNDPAKVPAIRERAVEGDVDAQYAMGLIYAEGRGVEIDLAQSHYWLSLAVEQGDKDANLLRNIVGSQMTDAEYAAAKRLRVGPNLKPICAD